MGLDMYLTKKYYVKNWDHTPASRKHKITITKGGKPSPIPADKVDYVETGEIYWRKANQIHAWFVKNVQKGVDDCGTYFVSTEDLKKLLADIEAVLSSIKTRKAKVHVGTQYTPTKDGKGKIVKMMEPGLKIVDTSEAERRLPVAQGCFFGSYEYDNFYIEDLEFTNKEITRALKAEDAGEYGDFYYHSSW
jgi:hypothetical protein